MRSKRPKVLYVASLSHSGSTLLDLMLNAHSQIVSVGELKQLGRYARFEKAGKRLSCTCGAPTILECDFWSRVNAHTQNAIGRTLAALNVESYDDQDNFQRDNVALFNAIAAVSAKRFIVDSSKSVPRLTLLMENTEIDVFPIFLLRNPKGQICSSKNRSTHLFRLIGRYVRTNREIYATIRHLPHEVIYYEELVQRPERTLTRVMGSVGLEFEPCQLEWAAPIRHNVGGNGMRRGTSSTLKLDQNWRHRLSLMEKLAIGIGTIPGRFPLLGIGATATRGNNLASAATAE